MPSVPPGTSVGPPCWNCRSHRPSEKLSAVTKGADDAGSATIRVSDTDRQAVIDRLREHTSAGRLTLDEFDSRVGEVMQGRTVADLRETLRDLPLPMPVLATQKGLDRQVRRRRAASHLRNFVGLNSICV